jgi:alkylation response protein AidB-like acyl-CoA dehydrogenase
MDFNFKPEQELLRNSVRDFAESVIAPRVAEMEEKDEMPAIILQEMATQGFMGVCVPMENGGAGLGHTARLIILEEIGRVSAAVAMTLQVDQLGIAPLVDFGTPDQKAKYLPNLASGEQLAALALTEAGGGSDPGGIQTTARQEGDNYVLNGRKVFITNSHIADITTVVARTGEGPRDFAAFLIEKDRPGFRPGRKEHKFGMKGCNTGEVVLQDCIVPKENIIGGPGGGMRAAMKAISELGRMGMAGCGLGVLRACLEAGVKFAKERKLGGKSISEFQAIQWKLTDIYHDLESAKLLCYRAAWMLDQKKRCDAEVASAKFAATEGAIRASKAAIDIHGGYGCLTEYAVQRYYRDAWLLVPSAGTSEVMRMVMARSLLV